MSTIQKNLRQLRNTRDLRAEMLALAAELVSEPSSGQLTVVDPVISEVTVQEEWTRMLPALAPEISARMFMTLVSARTPPERSRQFRIDNDVVLLERPNYRYEVLRLMLGANLEDDGPQTVQGLIELIGASQTPIRQAIIELKKAGLASSWGRGAEVMAEDMSIDVMAKLGAVPQRLRFRFEIGAQIKSPATLLDRVIPLLHPDAPKEWHGLSLSGTAVAQKEVPDLDLIGVPRLDLVAHVRRDAKTFNTQLLRLLDDGLELEPNVLAPAPVVLTLVRADTEFVRDIQLDNARSAYPMDVYLSLLDLGLRAQALQYAKAIRH